MPHPRDPRGKEFLPTMTPFNGWENFYVIIGSSAGALVGLQFVVMALIADMPDERKDPRAGNAFGTPNVILFSVALLISALVVAPWKNLTPVAYVWGLLGAAGIAYHFIVIQRMRAQTAYQAVFEDWLFYIWCPMAAYAFLFATACLAIANSPLALFCLAAATLLLLFLGIRNAWDTVCYHVFMSRSKLTETSSKETTP